LARLSARLARSFGGIISDRLGGVNVTLVNFILMALFTGLLFLTYPAPVPGVFWRFTWCLWGCFSPRVSAAAPRSR
jgi:NNP family nitrate/nitrite transporter-like MFS transporter